MGQIGKQVRTILYRNLSLDNYLKVLSSAFLAIYRLGAMKNAPEYEYPYFLKHLINKGDTVIDIGANLGYYSYVFARLIGNSGQVYVVEPVKPIFEILQHNVRKYKNVTLMNYALGAEEKVISMGNDSINVNGYFGTGQNFVIDKPATHTDITFDAEMKLGTKLFGNLRRINFIKCDIEGYENVVIPQIKPLIEQHKPIVLIETGGENRKLITQLFSDIEYYGYILDNNQLKPNTESDYKDIIFIPAARIEQYKNIIKQCE